MKQILPVSCNGGPDILDVKDNGADILEDEEDALDAWDARKLLFVMLNNKEFNKQKNEHICNSVISIASLFSPHLTTPSSLFRGIQFCLGGGALLLILYIVTY